MTKITLESNGVRVSFEAETLGLQVAPDNETAALFASLLAQGGRIEKGLIAMSQVGQEIIDKLTSAEQKLAAVDARTDAVQQMVGDLRNQVANLQTISDAERAAINASLDRIVAKLGTEADQLDATLTPPAP